MASGGAVARYFASDGLLGARTSIGWFMLAVGALIWVSGNHTYRRQAHAIRANEPTTVPARRIHTIAAVTTFVIATVIVIELLQV